jgi:hypothetical protein
MWHVPLRVPDTVANLRPQLSSYPAIGVRAAGTQVTITRQPDRSGVACG